MKNVPAKPKEPRAKPAKGAPFPGADPAVTALMQTFTHPLMQEVEVLRQIILGASPEIQEGVKWNSPSFRTTTYFATLNLSAKDRVRLILHRGAKKKEGTAEDAKIADPTGILEWLAKDRGLVTFVDAADVQAKRAALGDLVRAWIRSV